MGHKFPKIPHKLQHKNGDFNRNIWLYIGQQVDSLIIFGTSWIWNNIVHPQNKIQIVNADSIYFNAYFLLIFQDMNFDLFFMTLNYSF